MKIDKNLKLVFSLQTDSGTSYVHHTPIDEDLFYDDHALSLLNLNKYLRDNLAYADRAAHAYIVFKRINENENGDLNKQASNLLRDLKRGTWLIIDGEAKQFEVAMESGVFSKRLINEVFSKLLFFTLEFWLAQETGENARTQDGLNEIVAGLLGGVTTLLNYTEYRKFLMTSTEAATTGEKAPE